MNKRTNTIAAVLTAILFIGCSSTIVVEKPPRFVLANYRAIGIVQFSTNNQNGLGQLTTRRFIQAMQEAQPGTVLLELGPEDEVLRQVGKGHMDLEAVKAIGMRFNVDAVVTGFIETSDIKTKINFSLDLSSLRAQAKIQGTLGAKIYETERGGTAWTAERSVEWTVAKVSGGLNQAPRIGIGDREAKLQNMVLKLTYSATADFRPRYVRERKKD